MKVKGKCLCGAIQFVVTPKKEGFHADICHCSICQRWTGGPAFTITLEGPPDITHGEDLVATYQSSEFAQRCFCKICGSNLIVQSPKFGYYGISPGVLEHQDGLEFTKEIFIDNKPKFYNFAGGENRQTLTEAQFFAQFAPPPSTSNNKDPADAPDVKK